MMAVGGENSLPVDFQQAIICQNGKFQYHLIHLCIAVASDTEKFLLQGIQHSNYRLGIVTFRQIISWAVVEDVSQQKKAVGLLTLIGFDHFFAVICGTMDIRCNH